MGGEVGEVCDGGEAGEDVKMGHPYPSASPLAWGVVTSVDREVGEGVEGDGEDGEGVEGGREIGEEVGRGVKGEREVGGVEGEEEVEGNGDESREVHVAMEVLQ